LKPRLTANITIYTLEKANALAIPTKALRFVADESLLAPLGYTVGKAPSETPTGKRLVWVKSNKTISPKIISVGTASGNLTEVTEGLKEGEEVITELTSEQVQTEQATTEKSPFMPGPPGNNKKNNKNAK
jgi:HlyD family secretion protein